MLRFYADNLHLIESGLRLLGGDPKSAIEYKCGNRRADLFAIDEGNTLVVIEFKLEFGDPQSLGQLLSYMAWARRAFPRPVRGIIVARLVEPAMCIAASDLGDVAVFEYLPDKQLQRVTLGARHQMHPNLQTS